MENIRKSLVQVIVCLKKKLKGLRAATFLPELLETSCQESKITGTQAETVDISSVDKIFFWDQFLKELRNQAQLSSQAY